MNLRQKILLLASAPLIIAVSAITLLVTHQTQSLSEGEIASFKKTMLTAKKAELLNYLSLAESSIRHIYDPAGPGDEGAKGQVKEILHGLTYGRDGYFFVYDFKGNNLVHPRQSYRVGKNWWGLKDLKGTLVIQGLIQRAREGGGYQRYLWEKPSTGEVADKIGYATALDKWGWMLGTGLYIDDVLKQVHAKESEVSARVRETSLFIIFITLGALGFVFVTGIAINLHERRMADAKLKELTQRIVETQEEERGRVARELHDGISQILVSVKYALELAMFHARKKSDDVLKAIDSGGEALNVAIAEVRRISRDLRPSILDDLGLSPALESLSSEFSKRTGVEIDVSTVSFKDALSTDAKTTLFRVAQEALTNIERHAQATHVTLELSVSRKGINLTIADNGKGFAARKLTQGGDSTSGIGLRNMHERLEYHNGELSVSSSENGTTISARLPKGLLAKEFALPKPEEIPHGPSKRIENSRIAG